MTEKEFFDELAANDKLCKQENAKKSYQSQTQEFADFIAKNNLKQKGGNNENK